jgi:hypothetical protein
MRTTFLIVTAVGALLPMAVASNVEGGHPSRTIDVTATTFLVNIDALE